MSEQIFDLKLSQAARKYKANLSVLSHAASTGYLPTQKVKNVRYTSDAAMQKYIASKHWTHDRVVCKACGKEKGGSQISTNGNCHLCNRKAGIPTTKADLAAKQPTVEPSAISRSRSMADIKEQAVLEEQITKMGRWVIASLGNQARVKKSRGSGLTVLPYARRYYEGGKGYLAFPVR